MLNDYYEYTIADHWASAIVNGDYSGLTDDEEIQLDEFLGGLPTVAGILDIEGLDDPGFARCEVTGLLSNCVTLKLWFHNPELTLPGMLEDIAAGRTYYEPALVQALNHPQATTEERQAIQRYLDGSAGYADGWLLHDLALNLRGEPKRQRRLAKRAVTLDSIQALRGNDEKQI
jgi:hypothetical protein